MKQAEFEKKYQAFWQSCEKDMALLADKKAFKRLDEHQKTHVIADWPQKYRRLCQHLSIVKARRYTPALSHRLNLMVRQGYQLLYGNKFNRQGQLLEFLFYGFPQVIQANLRFVGIAALCFLLPGIFMWLATYLNDEMLYSIMQAEQVHSFETMYDPGLDKYGRDRQSDSDLYMFGFYIKNNISISFNAFASGLLFCVGSLFVLIYNGLFIGGAAGHISNIGYSETFYPFVIGHGSFELTAIVFSGAAGLKIGYALIAPGSLTRIGALQVAAKEAIRIVYGSTIMLFIAAFIEAYWSSSSNLSITVKVSVGALLWALVFYYCFFLGRKRYAAE